VLAEKLGSAVTGFAVAAAAVTDTDY